MGSKERIAREKEDVRIKILDAALAIITEEGCQALSMRKIADRIEYAVASIYEYFANKDSILAELTGSGYTILGAMIKKAAGKYTKPKEQLIAMCHAYWSFAFRHQELYKIMYGIQVSCPKLSTPVKNAGLPATLFTATIAQAMPPSAAADGGVLRRYYSLWSALHGLISLNLVNEKLSKEMNRQIVEETITAIINYKTGSK